MHNYRPLHILMVLGVLTHLSMSAPIITNCSQMMSNWLVHPQNLPSEVYMDSGKFINDLGDYNNCLFNKDQYTYFTMRFVNKLVGMQYVGLCAPNQCSEQISNNQFATSIQNYLNQLYMNKTGATSGIFYQTTFYIPIQTRPQPNWSNYCVIGLLSVIVILGIAGSIISKVTQHQNTPLKLIKSFSFVDNFTKIITVPKTTQNQNLLFLNGMRVLSIFWIVFGHDMWIRFMNIKNWMETLDILMTPGVPTLVPAAYFAVDTFFWIGGFLVTIGLLDQIVKAKSFIKFYFGCILHRFIRIWPTYMLAILIFWKIVPLLSNGPIWQSYGLIAGSCSDGGILWNMFFIDNFQNHGPSGMDYCFGWGWYLAVDFQLFLITPFIILAYIKNKKLGWLVTFILFFGSVLCAFILIMVNDWRYPIPNPKMKPQPDFMDNFYYKPYVRASTYMMGIFSGFIYYQWKQGQEKTVYYINYIKRSIPIRIALYVVGIFFCQFIIWVVMPFQTGESDWSTTAQAFYNSFNRVVFILGVYFCIFAAMFGCQNDPSKYILGHKMFSPLAKVSFCIYLVHLIVIMSGTFSGRMDLYWQPYSAIYTVISDIFWSTIVATILSLLIQAPTLGIQKILLKGSKQHKHDKDKNRKLLPSEQKKQKLIDSGDIYANRSSIISYDSSNSSQNRNVNSNNINYSQTEEINKNGELA